MSESERTTGRLPALPGRSWPRMAPGHVWLCGAGPGDPGLLTLHALNALGQAEIVVHDALIDTAILHLAPQAEHIAAGKRGGRASPKQRDISLRLVELACAGKRVLRLKGGDPFLFGRGGEEAQTLVQHGVPIRIVPGISAGLGGLAYAGIPATHRDVNTAITCVTGHGTDGAPLPAEDWAALAKGAGVLVIYMGMKHAGQIARALIAGGRPGQEPVAVVSEATMPGQKVLETSLNMLERDIAAAGMSPPAIICVGRAVLLRQALDWQAQAAGARPRDADPLRRGKPAEEG